MTRRRRPQRALGDLAGRQDLDHIHGRLRLDIMHLRHPYLFQMLPLIPRLYFRPMTESVAGHCSPHRQCGVGPRAGRRRLLYPRTGQVLWVV